MLYGYARVSTVLHQSNENQIEELKKAGVKEENIFQDKVSGTLRNRIGLQTCLSEVKEGDTLIVWSIDRLGRNTRHSLEIIEELKNKKVNFKSLKQGFDTNTSAGQLMFTILAAVAEAEAKTIKERIMLGLFGREQRLKAIGKKLGRPTFIDKLPDFDRLDVRNIMIDCINKKMSSKDIYEYCIKRYPNLPFNIRRTRRIIKTLRLELIEQKRFQNLAAVS